MKFRTFLKTHVTMKADRQRQTTVPMSDAEIVALDDFRASLSTGERMIPRAAFVRALIEHGIAENQK